MKTKLILSALLLATSSGAQAIDWGVGVKAGTVGYGADVSFVLTETLNLRASFTQADFNETDNINITDANNSATVNARMDVDFGSQALLLDWYVFDGTFHVTGGLMKNDSSISLNGNITSASVTFDGVSYNVLTAFQDSSMGGTVSFGNSFEPYLGIGWGRKADASDPGLSLSFEMGVVMMDPSVDLRAPTLNAGAVDSNGNVRTQAELEQQVNNAEATAAQDLDEFEMYPVISLGLNYAF